MKFTTIVKRDGREVPFTASKITDAIYKAAQSVGGSNKEKAQEITEDVVAYLEANYQGNSLDVEDVQDAVEKVLIETGHAKTAKAYIIYRNDRTNARQQKSDLMKAVGEILVETDKDNANISNSPSGKMLQIDSAASRAYYLQRVIPQELSTMHSKGDFHIHDLDFYGKTINCLQIPLREKLTNGFNTGHGYIRPPKRPGSATAQAAILLQSSQNDMFGGQSFSTFDKDMAPFMEGATEKEIFQAMEALVYNLNSMHSRAGAQVPFSSLNFGDDTTENGRAVIRNLLLAYERGLGRGENPIFPNLIFKVKAGVNLFPEDPNFDLLMLAIRVASKRMNPTFCFMDSSFNKGYDDVAYMGCRTRVVANCNGESSTHKRGNIAFVTLNLPRIGIKAKGNMDTFYQLLDAKIQKVIEILLHRYNVVKKLKVKDMPFVMGQKLYMGSENLKWNDPIEEAIKNGTLSLGFIGLAETLVALTGKHHGESKESFELGQDIVAHMRKVMDDALEEYHLNFSLIATPAEGLSGRFVKMDKKLYGEIPGVTDRSYYTNSFHVPVHFKISAFEKISIEGAFHKFCNAGHISYVEFSAPPTNNPQGVYMLIRHMAKSDMGYAGFNFPMDYCDNCGFWGVIPEDECPSCGTSTITRIRRITGYLSELTNFNEAKKEEQQNRLSHAGKTE